MQGYGDTHLNQKAENLTEVIHISFHIVYIYAVGLIMW